MEQKEFITELLRLADQLDDKGLREEADEIDTLVKSAQVDIEKKYPGYPLTEWRKLQKEKKIPGVETKPEEIESVMDSAQTI